MEIIKLCEAKGVIFDKIVEWNYNWWGAPNGESYEMVRSTMAHSVNEVRLPQTFVALEGDVPVGMYQLSMCDDLKGRPDIYPWLINVYVDEKMRGRGLCRELMQTVSENARAAGLHELYLYTNHVGLYEKFGWEFLELVNTFKEDSPVERLYRLELCKKSESLPKLIRKLKKCGQFELKPYEALVSYLKKNSKAANGEKLGVKLIVISDTHGDIALAPERFEHFLQRAGGYDLCVILGDIMSYELDEILKRIPRDKIIALRGNHDTFDVYDKHKIRNINGKIFKYKGVSFAGIEGSFRYKNENFPSYSQAESLALARKMKGGADVLLSHDAMFSEAKYDMAHAGLSGITYYAYKNAVKYHIHGHLHKSYSGEYSNKTVEKCVHGYEIVEI